MNQEEYSESREFRILCGVVRTYTEENVEQVAHKIVEISVEGETIPETRRSIEHAAESTTGLDVEVIERLIR